MAISSFSYASYVVWHKLLCICHKDTQLRRTDHLEKYYIEININQVYFLIPSFFTCICRRALSLYEELI